MKILRNKRRQRRLNSAGMELVGALSIASQMALFCPPGFDELVRRELTGDAWRSVKRRWAIRRGRASYRAKR